jgi:putative sterol carrier protein
MNGITEFFEGLAARGHEPLLGRASGTLRVELTNGKRMVWLVTIDKGDVTVSRRNARADSIIRTERKVFEEIVKGKRNVVAAVLRGAVTVDGAPELLVLFQRLLPGPAGKRS